jgi:small subunit ribosomal protein S1
MTDETVSSATDTHADSPVDTHAMEDLLSQEEYAFEQPKRGDVRMGTVVWVGPNEIVVDIGVKREGVVNSRDLERLRAEGMESITVGAEIPVYILKPEDQDGNLVVSIYLARKEAAWQRAKESLDRGDIYKSQVTGYNKGGLVVPYEGVPGFVPASQVTGLPRRMSEEERMQRLSQQVSREIVVRVIEVDRKRKRLVMSEEAAQRAWRDQRRKDFVEELTAGQTVHGVVRSLTNFGAFVDLGGVDGLIHISELSWQPVKHPNQVVHVGDEVDVRIVNLDKEQGKIGLSLRQLQPDPWTIIEQTFAVGQLVKGVVTNLVEFGAFVRLENGVEGLVHVSELADVEVTHPSDVVSRGETYLLEIIRIDPERRRIGLSLRRVPAAMQAQATG